MVENQAFVILAKVDQTVQLNKKACIAKHINVAFIPLYNKLFSLLNLARL